jgi:ADP-ribose pyrophosphatase
MKPWKTLRRDVILNHSKWLTVEDHTIQLPDGRTLERWPWVISPDYVNVAVVTSDQEFLCFRQTKYAVEGVSLAPVGGYIDPGEEPLAAAQRELDEETGYAAGEWVSLGTFPADGNHGAGNAHLFLALAATKQRDAVSDDLEEQELVKLSRAELTQAVARGDFKVLSWTTVMALTLLRLQGTPS